MILKRGELINNTYTVKFFIGQGAFGEVYRVEHKFLGLQVLKVLKAEYVLSSDLDTLIKEALILSKLTHENSVLNNINKNQEKAMNQYEQKYENKNEVKIITEKFKILKNKI